MTTTDGQRPGHVVTASPVSAHRQSIARMRALIAKIPRVKLAITPTPLVEAPNLSKALGGPRIFIKHDDMSGSAFGGNKLRLLEFRLAQTLAERADTVIFGLDVQSNSARCVTAACNKLGLRTILVLLGSKPSEVQGNLLVDYLLGAEIHFAKDAAEQRGMLDDLAQRMAAAGGRPHIMNDNVMFYPASAIAYIEATMEILEQLDEQGLEPRCLYMSSGGKGQAGVVLAQRELKTKFEMRGVTASGTYDVPVRTAELANQTARVLGVEPTFAVKDVVNYDGFVGDGYGIPSPAGTEAVFLFARTEGVIVDPIYSGKCAAAMIAHIREGQFRKDDVVVFVHTGGTPAIFTWNKLWLDREPARGTAPILKGNAHVA
jgi:1-aminocyclopropane-1-carboxylate deaminase/D-cysteine desulfhydrase-like pyridoxal-dependent ACC family enzyme